VQQSIMGVPRQRLSTGKSGRPPLLGKTVKKDSADSQHPLVTEGKVKVFFSVLVCLHW